MYLQFHFAYATIHSEHIFFTFFGAISLFRISENLCLEFKIKATEHRQGIFWIWHLGCICFLLRNKQENCSTDKEDMFMTENEKLDLILAKLEKLDKIEERLEKVEERLEQIA